MTKNLKDIVKDTLGFGAIIAPLYIAGKSAIYTASPIEVITDENTWAVCVGMTIGKGIYEAVKAYQSSKKNS